MAKNQIQVSLKFNADTGSAKASLIDLEKSLNKLYDVRAKASVTGNLTQELDSAAVEAKKLLVALQSAVNMDTGKFDLTEFRRSLKTVGTDLTSLRKQLSAAGPEGEQAFNNLAQAIIKAEAPTRRLSKTLDDFFVQLKKTAQWQLTSNVTHGLQGALQTAYHYAQDLNRSLNDIRIVTGYNIEQMDAFAAKANEAAKALSTTTTDYAKASLIYFQQGLNDDEVLRRTQATIKMANVTGQAAEDVSEQMTAIWNNFDDGTKSLETYADVITALGAATASSSEEISEGLQKFAAVANMVGLSYEYATAALATVTSQTRESADTVGTAFKTIFARLQSLSLGETLDDDTTLTKYSIALSKVGVNIKDANGDLRAMDDILDDLSEKWQMIDKDQRAALAQTVAGMRQYNNFIALMDNYDTFEANIKIAEDSKGTLEEQQKIYAESWQAAADRVKAAAESIYTDLIEDEAFIKLLDIFEKLLSFVDQFIDSLGGLRGILATVSLILTQVFNKQLQSSLHNASVMIQDMTGVSKKQDQATRNQAVA